MTKKILVLVLVLIIGCMTVNAQQEIIKPGGIGWLIFDYYPKELVRVMPLPLDYKIEKMQEYIEQRQQEMEYALENNVSKKILNKIMNSSEKYVLELKEKIPNIEPAKREQIQNNLQKHIEVLKRVKEKVPEQAMKGIETAIEESLKKIKDIQEQKINAGDLVTSHLKRNGKLSGIVKSVNNNLANIKWADGETTQENVKDLVRIGRSDGKKFRKALLFD